MIKCTVCGRSGAQLSVSLQETFPDEEERKAIKQAWKSKSREVIEMDVHVFSTNRALSEEEYERMKKRIEDVLPDEDRVLILEEDLTLLRTIRDE